MYIGLHSRDGWLGVAGLAGRSAYRTVGQIIHNIGDFYFIFTTVGGFACSLAGDFWLAVSSGY